MKNETETKSEILDALDDLAVLKTLDSKYLSASQFAAVKDIAINGFDRCTGKSRKLARELVWLVRHYGQPPWSDAALREAAE